MTQPSGSIVIADTTPLITLAATGAIYLLPVVFGEVHIPEQVWGEYEKFRPQMTLPDLAQASWLKWHQITIAPPFSPLDEGEAAALTLAQALRAKVVLMDERKGRKAAAAVQLPIMGTLGFLLRAKRDGHITAIKPIIDQFTRLDRYYSPHLIAQTLQAAGE
jgi:predicted nucleic acid-binding protein